MATEYTSASGIGTSYGPRLDETEFPLGIGAKESTRGNLTELEYRFNLTGPLPAGSTVSNLVKVIPANACILSAVMYVEVAAAGSSGVLDIGLIQQDGGAADPDGLFDGIAQATMAVNTWHLGNGALLPAGTVTNDGTGTDPVITTLSRTNAEPTQVVASVASGTFTGGRVRVIITYLRAEG